MNKKLLETSLGPPLSRKEDYWEIDLQNLRLFTGLSVLSKILGDQVLEQVENSPGDISILYKINPSINPELTEMHFFYIQINARSGILKDILLFREDFQDHLRGVFGTFQRPFWGKKIHPEFYGEDPKQSKTVSLIFPYHHASDNDDVNYQFILERVESASNKGEFFLRLTIENHDKANLDLSTIPHEIVDDLKLRVYLAGSTKMSESINNSIQVSAAKGQKFYSEENRTYSHLFEQFSKTALGNIDRINFHWDKSFAEYLRKSTPGTSLPVFKKIFLTLEDQTIGDLLKHGETIRISIGKIFVSLFLSRLGRVLNFNFNLPRQGLNLSHYLKRMPELESIANKDAHDLSFENINIFLIHHITSEILALIEAFRRLSVNRLNVAFVKYGGIIPAAYLDVLLDIPTENFFMSGLIRKSTKYGKDYYTVSGDYSDPKDLEKLNSYLEKEQLSFFDAMRLLAGNTFLRFCKASREENKKVILIEDGGYVSPFINDYILSKKSLNEVLEIFQIGPEKENPDFGEWIQGSLLGTVEHTRNGYDRLISVQEKYSKLFFPAYSIAISENKVKEESKEVAHSILSAIESILHGQGMVLSQRKFIVLGSEGNIGRYLSEYLFSGRMHEKNRDLLKVDIKYTSGKDHCYYALDDIESELFLGRDLFIGVIGASILTERHIENLILNGNKTKLIFASGSTKTVEFSDLSEWLNKLAFSESPKIAGIPVSIEFERIQDPQSGIDQGGKIILSFEKNGLLTEKILYLLSDLSPINFLFYGVPTETMDTIISQLTSVSLGMVDQFRKSSLPVPALYAVDSHIDKWGHRI